MQTHCVRSQMQLSAAVISYLGAFTGSYRDESVVAWVKACKKVRALVRGESAERSQGKKAGGKGHCMRRKLKSL